MIEVEAISGSVEFQDKASGPLDDIYASFKRMDRGIADANATLDAWRNRVDQNNSAMDRWLGTMTAVAGGVATGLVAVKALSGAASTLVGTGKQVVNWLTGITLEGDKVGDVAENFETLANGAGIANDMLRTLREGTHNTVSDLKLMQLANADLVAGLKLSTKDMEIMSRGAFALAQATGGEVVDGLEAVNRALLTGQTRSIASLTGKINLQKAEENFAKSLGTTADKLNQEGKLQAARIGILNAVSEATDRLGEQTDGLGEIVDQASTWWENFQNKLGQTLATSPILVTALTAVKDEFFRTFGSNQDELVQKINEKVTDLTVGVINLAKYGVESTVSLVSGFASLGIVIGDTVQVLQGVQLAYLGTKKFAMEMHVGPLAKSTQAWKDLDAQIEQLEINMSNRGKTLKYFEDLRDNSGKAVKPVLEALDRTREKVKTAGAANSEFVGPLQSVTRGLNAGTEAGDRFTKSLDKVVQKASDAGKKRLAAIWDEWTKANEANQIDPYANAAETGVFNANKKLSDLDIWLSAEKRKLEDSKKNNKFYWEEVAALDALYWEKRETLQRDAHRASMTLEMQHLKERTDAMAQAIEDSINYAPKATILSDVPGATSAWLPDLRQIGKVEQTLLSMYSRVASGTDKLVGAQSRYARDLKATGMSAQQIAQLLGVSYESVRKTIGSTREEVSKILDQWAQSIAQIGQLAGGSETKLGRMIADVGNIVVSWNSARKAMDAYTQSTTAAGKALALVQAGQALWQATGSGSTASRIIGGAATGAEIGGQVAGPLGAIIGGIGGGILGWARSIGAAERQVNDLRDAFQSTFGEGEGGFNKMSQAAYEATGSLELIQNLLNAKTVDDYTAAQKALTEALQHHNEVMSTINGMGFQSQKQLDDDVKKFRDAYEEMQRQGTYTTDQLAAAWKKVQEAMDRAAHDPAQEMADKAAAAGYESKDDLAKKAEEARKLAEYMRESGKYTAEQIEDAFEKAAEAEKRAIGINTKALDEMQAKYDELIKGISQEAPEAEMGVIERQMRQQAEDLEKQIKAQTDATTQQAQDKWSETAERYKNDWTKAGDMTAEEFKKWWNDLQQHLSDGNRKLTNDNYGEWATMADETGSYIVNTLGGIKIRIPVGFDVEQLNLPGGSGSSNNDSGIAMADGGFGYASGPMTFRTQGNEFFAFSGEGEDADTLRNKVGGSGSGGPVTIQVMVGNKVVKEAVFDELETAPNSRDIKVIRGLVRAGKR